MCSRIRPYNNPFSKPIRNYVDKPRGRKLFKYRKFNLFIDDNTSQIYFYSVPSRYAKECFENIQDALDYIDNLIDNYDGEINYTGCWRWKDIS